MSDYCLVLIFLAAALYFFQQSLTSAALISIAGAVLLLAKSLHVRLVENRLFLMAARRYFVLRNSKTQNLSGSQLVIGDIIFIKPGDVLPADGRIIQAQALVTYEEQLSGNPQDMKKSAHASHSRTAIEDRKNMVYAGTTVVSGKAKVVVTALGKQTALSHIMLSLAAQLQSSMEYWRHYRILQMVLVISMAFLIGSGVFLVSNSVTAALLLLELLIILLVAGRENAKRKPFSAHLASLDCIVADFIPSFFKVGREFHFSFTGDKDLIPFQPGKKLHPYSQLATAGLSFFPEAASFLQQDGVDLNQIRNQWHEQDQLTSAHRHEYRAFLAHHPTRSDAALFVLGQAEFLLHQSASFLASDGSPRQLTAADRHRLHLMLSQLAGTGKRITALAVRQHLQQPEVTQADVHSLLFIGVSIQNFEMLPQATKYLRHIRAKNSRLIIATSENASAAAALAAQMGFHEAVRHGLDAEQLHHASDRELKKVLPTITLASNMTLADKQRLVRLLQADGNKVGYMAAHASDMAAALQADLSLALPAAAPSVRFLADYAI